MYGESQEGKPKRGNYYSCIDGKNTVRTYLIKLKGCKIVPPVIIYRNIRKEYYKYNRTCTPYSYKFSLQYTDCTTVQAVLRT